MATIQAMVVAASALQGGFVTRNPSSSSSFYPSVGRHSLNYRRNWRITTCQAASKDRWDQTVSQPDTFTRYSGYIAKAAIEEADQLDVYNADKIAAVFRRRPFLLARRLLQIVQTLGWWAALRYVDTLLGKKDTNFKKRASQLRGALVQLGPAFVKIAQAVSSRPDVISPEYLEELALLQDRIAPFSTELALEIIEQELGVPMEQLFSEISPQPIAAASLGQVYQARLRPNGKLVAVKVQRPGVRAAMALDLFLLRKLAAYAKSILKLNTDLPSVVDEWASSLFKEMDYQAEARNGIRFRKLFGDLPDVVVPEMYSELTSRRVLVMEWVEGQRLSEISDLRLVEVGVFCSLTQLLDSGFYHADPHPGNLLRTPDGKLAYLDFGMMGEMKENLRDGLIEASVHLVNREFGSLAGDFVTLGLLPPTAEKGAVSKALTDVFQQAVSKGVRNISFGDLSGKLGVTMYNFKFRIPSYFSLVIRSLTVLEGIALSSDPNYKVLSSSYPWIARKVLTDKSPKIRSTLQELVYKNGAFRIDRLESLLTESMRQPMEDPAVLANKPMLKQEEKVERDSRALVKRLLTFALTEQGDFVRDLILEELAKGVDALNRVAFDAATQTIRTNSPVSLPFIAPVTEEEDLKNVENLRQIMAVFNRNNTSTTSGVGTVSNMTTGESKPATTASSTNFRTTTQVSASNHPNDLVQTSKVEKVGSSQNGAMRTSLVEANNGKDIIQRTEVVNNNNTGISKSDNSTTKLVPRTQVFKGANDNDIVERTRFVKSENNNSSPERSLSISADDINDLVQSLTALQRYLPLLSVFPELPFQAQQQALLLPAELAGRIASRVVARSIRGSIPANGDER